jgi:hypothetical protein
MRYRKGSDADRFVFAIGLEQLRERGTKRKTIRATNFIVLHGNCIERVRRKATSPHFVRGLASLSQPNADTLEGHRPDME